MTQRPTLRVYPGAELPDHVVDSWSALWADSAPHPTPFLHPRATVTAAAVVDATEVAVVSEGDRPVAFLPFERRGRRGLPVAADVSDGDGMVAAPHAEVPMVNVLRGAGLRSLSWTHRDATPSPLAPWDHYVSDAAMVDLSDGFDAYAEWSRSQSSVLKQAGRKSRKLGREVGDVSFELLDDHGLARQLVSRKVAQVTAAGSPGRMPVDGATALIEAFGRTWTGDGFHSALSVLRAGDDIVAMSWGITAGSRFVLCVPWYDDSLQAYSPGLVLMTELLRNVGRLGATLVDMGLAIDQSKARLLTHRVPMASGELWASVTGRLYRRARTIARERLRD